MNIQTNMNRDIVNHNNIKYKPIEQQLLDFLLESKKFDKVEFCSDRSGQYFKLNNNDFQIAFSYDNQGIKLGLSGDYLGLLNNQTIDYYKNPWTTPLWMNIPREISYKENAKDIINAHAEKALRAIKLYKEAHEILGEFKDEKIGKVYETKINAYLKGYFGDELYNSPTIGSLVPYNFFTTNTNLSLHFGNKEKDSYGASFHIGLDGKINDIKERFVYAVEYSKCKKYMDSTCNDLEGMSHRLETLKTFKTNLEKFDGMKCPELKTILELEKKGYELRKKIFEQK